MALFGKPGGNLVLDERTRAFGLYPHDGITPFPAESLSPIQELHGASDVPPVEMLPHSKADQKEHKISMSAGAIGSIVALFRNISSLPDIVSQQHTDTHQTQALSRFSKLLAHLLDDVNRIAEPVPAAIFDVFGDVSATAPFGPGSQQLNPVAQNAGDAIASAKFKKRVKHSIDADDQQSLENSIMNSGIPVAVSCSDGSATRRSSLLNRFIDGKEFAHLEARLL